MNVALMVLVVVSGLGANGAVERDMLLSLLETLDKLPINQTAGSSELGVFLETEGNFFSSGGRRRSPPRRRHSACECPDNLDSLSVDCLNRRLGYADAAVEEILETDSTGYSVDSGRLGLRTSYSTLDTVNSNDHNRVQWMQGNISSGRSSAQLLTAQAVKRVLNEEYLLAQSGNNAWMNLINMSTNTGDALSLISTQLTNATDNILSYFNNLQNSEEWTTYANQQSMVSYLDAYVNGEVSEVSEAEESVYSVLRGLDFGMGGVEDNLSALSDSLGGAADSLQDKLDTFRSSFSDYSYKSEAVLGRSLDDLIRQYESAGNTAGTTFSSLASSKQQLMEKSSGGQIRDQSTAMGQLFGNTSSEIQTAIDIIKSQRTSYLYSSTDSFTGMEDLVSGLVDNSTQAMSFMAEGSRGNISILDQRRDLVAQSLSSLSNDERKAESAASASNLAYQASASKSADETIASFGGRQNDFVKNGQQTANGAVDSVGSNSQGSLDGMLTEYDKVQQTLATSANEVSMSSKTVTSSLTSAGTTGSNAVGAASESISDSVSSVSGTQLNDLLALSSSMGYQPNLAALNDVGANSAGATKSAVNTAANSKATGSLTAETSAENNVSDWLNSLSSFDLSSQETMDKLASMVSQWASAASSTSSDATTAGTTLSNAYSGAAGDIADSTNAYNQMMTDLWDSVVGTMDGAASGTSNPTDPSGNFIDGIESNLDIATDGQVTALVEAGKASDEASNGLKAVESQSQSDAQLAANQVDGAVKDATADLDDFWKSVLDTSSSRTGSNANDIADHQSQMDIQLGKFNVGQLDQIRAVASAIDSLMGQMNSFLQSGSPDLYAVISGLPSQVQLLSLRMVALSKGLAQIQETLGPQVSADALTDYFSMYVRKLNSTALDQLGRTSSDFNVSANVLSTSLISQVSDLAQRFAEQASAMKADLSSMTSQAADASVTVATIVQPGDDGDAITQLELAREAAAELFASSTKNLTAINEDTAVQKPSNISSVYASISSMKTLAAGDATAVSAILDQLKGTAQAQVQAVSTFAKTDGQSPVSDLEKQATIARMNEEVAAANLKQRQAAVAKLDGDVSATVRSYTDSANAQIAQRSEAAQLLYDSVLQSRADTANQLGSIAAKYATTQATRASDNEIRTQSGELAMINLQNQLAILFESFNQHNGGDAQLLEQATQTRTENMATHLMEVSKNMTRLGDSFSDVAQSVVANMSSLTQAIADLAEAGDIEATAASLRARVSEWQQAQEAALSSEETEASSIPKAFNFVSNVQSPINTRVKDIANQAIQLLQGTGKSIPARLQELAAS